MIELDDVERAFAAEFPDEVADLVCCYQMIPGMRRARRTL
jgi:hypothetical protein